VVTYSDVNSVTWT